MTIHIYAGFCDSGDAVEPNIDCHTFKIDCRCGNVIEEDYPLTLALEEIGEKTDGRNRASLYAAFRQSVQRYDAVHIYNAFGVSGDFLENMLNTLTSMHYKGDIAFYFSGKSKLELIHDCSILKWVKMGIVNHDSICEEIPSDDQIEKCVVSALPGASQQVVKHIIALSGKDVEKARILALEVGSQQSSFNELTANTFASLFDRVTDYEMGRERPEFRTLLQKAAIIGSRFSALPLEDGKCFDTPHAGEILEESQAAGTLVKKNGQEYMFSREELHDSVNRNIPTSEKANWEKVLLSYYVGRLQLLPNDIFTLEQIVRLSEVTHNSQYMVLAGLPLLKTYVDDRSYLRASRILDLLLDIGKPYLGKAIIRYLESVRIRLHVEFRDASRTLSLIDEFKRTHPYADSLFLKYWQAQAHYNSGDIDEAYALIRQCIEYLSKNEEYASCHMSASALVYSLGASIERHIGKDDGGRHLFDIARKFARCSSDQETHYLLCKQYDMFIPWECSKASLEKAKDYFKKRANLVSYAEICFNMATEYMFCEEFSHAECQQLFDEVGKVFDVLPGENYLYYKNNMAISNILYEADFDAALNNLKEALSVSVSAEPFTYFTIYFNVCMCCIGQNQKDSEYFEKAYLNFLRYKKELCNRENPSQYAQTYSTMLEIAMDEVEGMRSSAYDKAQSLSNSTSDAFVKIALKDTMARTGSNPRENSPRYPDHPFFYKRMNDLHIYLAEFRYWE